MKRVQVNAWQVGLVMKNGVYQKLLLTGSYWFWSRESVLIYPVTQRFNPPVELNMLLRDPLLADLLDVIEVKDGEIVLRYANGLLTELLSAGRYCFWKSVIRNEFIRADISQPEIGNDIPQVALDSAVLAPYIRTVSVEPNEKAVLFVDGRYQRILNSGMYRWWKNSRQIYVGRADMRQLQTEVNGQEILTKDKATLRINAWGQYRIADIEKALVLNKDYEKQLYVLFQLALREFVSGYTLDELLERKDNLPDELKSRLQGQTAELGVELSMFGIRDIILPGDVREIMQQVLVAEKKAQAGTILRREETAATRSLLNTAKLMEENSLLWKLKEMEYVEKIAEKINTLSVSGNGAILDQLRKLFLPEQ